MAVTKDRRREITAAYYLRHKDSIRAKQNEYDKTRKKEKKQYYIDNKEDILTKRKQYYADNRDTIINNVSSYRKLHKDRVRQCLNNYINTHPTYLNVLGKAMRVSLLLSPVVKKRDNYLCQLCNNTKSLIIHHIVPKFSRPDLIDDINNLITLCKDCHLLAHDNHYKRLDKQIQIRLITIIEKRK